MPLDGLGSINIELLAELFAPDISKVQSQTVKSVPSRECNRFKLSEESSPICMAKVLLFSDY